MGIICFYGYLRKRQQLNDYITGKAEAFKSPNEKRFKSQCTLRGLLRADSEALVRAGLEGTE
jgi:hypothetical protein